MRQATEYDMRQKLAARLGMALISRKHYPNTHSA
jgi:hypothetical protein